MKPVNPEEAFVALADPETAKKLRSPGKRDPYDFGYVPAMGRLLAVHDEIGPLFRALFAQVMFRPGHMSRAEREMVAAVAAVAQDCHY